MMLVFSVCSLLGERSLAFGEDLLAFKEVLLEHSDTFLVFTVSEFFEPSNASGRFFFCRLFTMSSLLGTALALISLDIKDSLGLTVRAISRVLCCSFSDEGPLQTAHFLGEL
jgi:hypothetical protein